MTEDAFQIRRLSPADAAAYRDLRLDALRLHPQAFGAAWAEESAHPLARFEHRLAHTTIFGATLGGAAALTGMAGFYALDGAKQRHKGVLWGMFVAPAARGRGLGAALVAQAVEHARHHVEELRLAVLATNATAIRLYGRAGFEPYGLERRALKVGDEYHDELLMALSPLRPAGAPQ